MLRVAAALLLALSVAPLSAQREIRVGQTVRGTLTAADSVLSGLQGETHFRSYAFRARRDQRIAITLRSSDSPPYALVECFGNGAICQWAVDFEGGAARMVVSFPEDGEYAIRASLAGTGSTGAYALTVRDAPVRGYRGTRGAVRIEGPAVAGELDHGDPVAGPEAGYYEEWRFEADSAGVLLASAESDGMHLEVRVGTGRGEDFTPLPVEEGVTGAFVAVPVVAGRRYVVRVRSTLRDQVGAYRLRLTRAIPVEEGPPTDQGEMPGREGEPGAGRG